MKNKPVIGVSADTFEVKGHIVHAAQQKYLLPILSMGAIPRLIPSLGAGEDAGHLLQDLDGLLMTGATSNVEPTLYGGAAPCPPYDPARDATTLPLIRTAIERGVPLLCICRGNQELNVALGGSLFPRLQDLPGRLDHREPENQPQEVQYAPAHPVTFTPGGFLGGLAGRDGIMVNSLHWQGIDRLGAGLVVEAVAPDSTVEAVRVEAAGSFAVGIQWHPEWRHAEDPFSVALFKAFSDAVHRKT